MKKGVTEGMMIHAVNFKAALESVTEYWSPKVVERVNDQYVKVAKLKGSLAWHKHDQEDELFQVVYGTLRIDLENAPDVILNPGECCVVPKGVLHNPIADEECGIVLIETISTKHTGDVVTPHTRSITEQLTAVAPHLRGRGLGRHLLHPSCGARAIRCHHGARLCSWGSDL
jgi:mannose-6-phosphate isomerase-like protein (cupin superfamily)